MPNHEIPLIRVDIEQMSYSIRMALLEYGDRVSQIVQDQITVACTSGRLDAVITARVNSEIERVIGLAIEDFFRVGPGRDAIRDAVHAAWRHVAASRVGGE